MKLRAKAYIFVAASTVAVTLLFAAISLFAYRSYSIESARSQAHVLAGMTRTALDEVMLRGVYDHHEELIQRLTAIPEIDAVEVFPGPSVLAQYGEIAGDPADHKPSPLVQQVLEHGKPVEHLEETPERVQLHYATPYTAISTPAIDCLQCHDAEVGDVLGAVALTIDLTPVRHAALQAVGSVAALIVLLVTFAGLLGYFLRRQLTPTVETANELRQVVGRAADGDFSGRLHPRSSDEIGEIAELTNRLMTLLEESIGSIKREVTHYLGASDRPPAGRSQLLHTVEVVHSMVAAASFKQALEQDRDLDAAYDRVRRTLRDEFGLRCFSLYEKTASGRSLRLVFAEGLPESAVLWCDPEIIERSELCRVCHTGSEVDACRTPNLCPAFFGNRIQQEQTLTHLCLPIFSSGKVDGVLQIVCGEKALDRIEAQRHRLGIFMREAQPVLESKRLLHTLNRSLMLDPLTGLNNRRFLENFADALSSGVQRRQGTLGVLMCDLDHFKEVNDIHGHDIGDEVLRNTANLLRGCLRQADLIVRYGGEEFVVLLMDSEPERVREVAERIRGSVADHVFRSNGDTLRRTISIGSAIYPRDAESLFECIRCADMAMYEAKHAGRNRVVQWEESAPKR